VGKGGYYSTIGICESKVSLVISKLFRLCQAFDHMHKLLRPFGLLKACFRKI